MRTGVSGWAWRAAAVAVAVLVAAAAVTLYGSYHYAGRLLREGRHRVANLAAAVPGGPTNILLVGSDSREGLSPGQLGRIQTTVAAGQRTDTIILVHLSPARRRAVMVSIPRDLRVRIDGQTNKLNAAYALGGPSLAVKTVQQVTGVPINHYVELDFAGFLKVVDALGGVRLCNPTGRRWDDSFANLHMAAHSCQLMDGIHALAYVRARHVDSDFGRIGRQQAFIRAVMGKLTSAGNLVNLPKMLSIANAMGPHVHSDSTLTTGGALALARRVGSMSASSVDLRVYPSSDPGPACTGCPDYVVARPEAAILMTAIARDAPVLPPVGLPSGGAGLEGAPVQVLNGGGRAGAARWAAAAVRADGLTVVGTGDAPAPRGTRSTLAYPPALATQAQLLRFLLDPQVRLVPGGPPGQLVLIVGSAYQPPAPAGAPSARSTSPSSSESLSW
ncbi:MAG TPA: LCP family protein [Actinomycetes bacterium]|nr:LCP family protein [Actinomycetes bacterium]